MDKYIVMLTRTEFLIFICFIKQSDNFISLLDRFQKGEIKMFKCYE
jgi:hypothetical protein